MSRVLRGRGLRRCPQQTHPVAHNPKVVGSNPAPATKKTLGIPTFPRVFSRSGVGCFGASTGLLPAVAGGSFWDEQALEHPCRFSLHSGEDVLVGVDGECRVPMSEPFRNDLDWYPGLDEQGAVGVS